MDKKQLKDILEKHNEWLDSRGKKGEKADFRGTDMWGADLRRANLQKSNLQGVNLQGANLQEANLQEANLQEANLQEADLRIAYLRVADLRGANFQEADLQGADLWVADLREADLWQANLREANLQETDLRGANLEGTNLKYVKITKDTISHIPEKIKKKFADYWYIIGGEEEKEEISDIRSIEFPLEYQKAGIWGLNYFGRILQEKYTETDAVIRIEQYGPKLTLIIERLEGGREVIEQTLDKYDMSVTWNTESKGSKKSNEAIKKDDLVISLEQKILTLKNLLNKELITQDEYDRKKAALLEKF
ncbi:MAG: pentapeptide repeat-containing protein [Desulfobacteraceae bacterium]|nr:pentapeptide repeat-containing protein [Desulfobacteraceae bacterium]